MADPQSTSVEPHNAPASALTGSIAYAQFDDRFLTVGDSLPTERWRPGTRRPTRRVQPSSVPRLLLQGRWLEAAGFPKGSCVRVEVTHDCLIVRTIPMVCEPKPRLPREGAFTL